jgi:sarcosine oxidase, subunit beta
VRARCPGLRVDDLSGALWGPADGYIDAAQLCRILGAEAEGRGWTIGVSTQVRAIEAGAKPRFTLDTDRGQYSCERLVNAAGAWAAAIGAMAGIRLPVAGYRRQVAVYEVSPAFARTLPIVVVPPREAGGSTVYFRDDGDGKILAGIHSEQRADGRVGEPDAYDRRADPAFKEELAAEVSDRLVAGYTLTDAGGWSGLYPISADGEPILGEATKLEGFYNLVALGGNGIQLSGAIGRLTADLICEGHSRLLPALDRYRLERFAAVP